MSSKNLNNGLLNNKKAELVSILTVIVLIGTLMAAAYFLPGGSSITGFATYSLLNESNCSVTLTDDNSIYNLSGDIGPCGGDGIKINANNVTVDCKGFSIIGADGGGDDYGVDVSIYAKTNISVKNCLIEGFGYGIFLGDESDGVIIENNSFRNFSMDSILSYAEWGIYANNIFYNGSSNALKFINASYNTVYDNDFYNNGSGANSDMYLNNQSDDNSIYNNNFYGLGILDLADSNSSWCVNGVGNNYSTSSTNFPNSYDCGYAWINGSDFCAANIPIKNTYLTSNISTCSGDGLNIAANNVTIDCQGYSIRGNGASLKYGIDLKNNLYNFSIIKNCDIQGFANGINILDDSDNTSVLNCSIWNSTTVGISSTADSCVFINNSIYNNTYGLYLSDSDSNIVRSNFFNNSITKDVYIDAISSNSNFSSNTFLATGVNDLGSDNSFCENISNILYGNFHPSSVTPPSDDCGGPIAYPSNESIWLGVGDYIPLFWKAQDGSHLQGINYNITIYSNSTGETQITNRLTSASNITNSWAPPFDGVPYNRSFKFNVTSYVGSTQSYFSNMTDWFWIYRDTDSDGDGYTVSQGDCDDGDVAQYPTASHLTPDNKCEDYSNRIIDWDCDTIYGWSEPECGAGFNAADYSYNFSGNDSLSIEGVLLNNSYGSVYFPNIINFTGMDLSDVVISQNFVSVDESLTNIVNQRAVVNFTNLPYQNEPALLRNGVICPLAYCTEASKTYNGSTYSFTANSFSNYSTTNNSQLNIYNDSVGETWHRMWFYANYTKFGLDSTGVDKTGTSINNESGENNETYNGGNCYLDVIQDWNDHSILTNEVMEYDSTMGLYKHRSEVNIYNISGYYSYNITCTSNIYENQTVSQTIGIDDDETAPINPILYKQIWLHPTNQTTATTTDVAGYFNESDITANIAVVLGEAEYAFNINTESSIYYSTYEGDSIVVNYNALEGEDTIFIEWSEVIEDAFTSYDYVEFSNHNKSHFTRYNISNVTRTGNDIRINFTQALEDDVPQGTSVLLHSAALPSGWFNISVDLIPGGVNRISAWGTDTKGNSGFATDDYLNYPAGALSAVPNLATLPGAVNSNFSFMGFINTDALDPVNVTFVVQQGDYTNSSSFNVTNSSVLNGTTTLTADRPSNSNFVYILEDDYADFDAANWPSMFVQFPNHNLSNWQRYDIESVVNNPGENPRVYISPNLTNSVTTGSVISLYNTVYPHGWFNETLVINDTYSLLRIGSNTIYAVTVMGGEESNPSTSQTVYYDNETPIINTSSIANWTSSSTPTISFNISDNYLVNTSTLMLNVSNGTNHTYYAVSPEVFNNTLGINLTTFGNNISCTELTSNTLYQCSVQIDVSSEYYNLTLQVNDSVNNYNSTKKQLQVILANLSIASVNDFDDLTSNHWIYANWSLTANDDDLDYYEVAVGTSTGSNNKLAWQTTSNNYINVTHFGTNSTPYAFNFSSGEIYYFTVKARNKAGSYSVSVSSDGILFYDDSAPTCPAAGYSECVDDGSTWTNNPSQLGASWYFQDNESEIVQYEYSIGTQAYPTSGFESIKSRSYTTDSSVTASDLTLVENTTYKFNVRAKNGNDAINFTGSWSPFQTSTGITTDFTAPTGGNISYSAANLTIDRISVYYNTGNDSISGINRSILMAGTSTLPAGNNNTCPPIYSYDAFNVSVPDGASWNNVSLTQGKCHAFQLRVIDNAGNAALFTSGDLIPRIAVDSTDPSDIASVTDDGFYTYNKNQLHAAWDVSSDPETGIQYYAWSILWDDPDDATDCDGSPPNNCTVIPSGTGTITDNELTMLGLNLTHSYKYYFKIIPYNGFGADGNATYSNGIIYIDNSPPSPAQIVQINNDTNSSNGWNLVNESDSTISINFTAEASSDCRLTYSDLDHTTLAHNCPETVYGSGNYSCLNTTVGKNDINSQNSTDGQGNFTWYISCADSHGNGQTWQQNTHVNFNIDWIDSPYFTDNITVTGSSPVYTNSTANCSVSFADKDEDVANATFLWYDDNTLIRNQTNSISIANYTQDSFDLTTASSQITRDSNLTCNITLTDQTSRSNSSIGSAIVQNIAPTLPELQAPVNASQFNDDFNLTWTASSDVDGDFITYEVQVDNESTFSLTNNRDPTYSTENISTTAFQMNPSIYGTKMVWQDNRSGNWDIFLYDFVDQTELQITTSSSNDTKPVIYNNRIFYQRGSGTYNLRQYTINTYADTQVATSITDGVYDVWNNFLVYHISASGLYLKNLSSSGTSVINSSTSIDSVSIYGYDIAWEDGGIYLYDIVSNKTEEIYYSGEDPKIFGNYITFHNSTAGVFYYKMPVN
ncbi:hypothetical protein HOK51_10385 [Candidatus Woesearchaeota archaeon]|jgi:beta propeller repeat protein|nr:hypothetical protein [Candidatus Woesearchaeota archaeon]MBT6520230.1 hypothetical protein [Candidatus Woesearchaeota archaeon]MBT7367241.1 hypothetical protein [Candidatus Woesearchaeota archaeon]